MKKLLLALTFLILSFSAFASQTITLNYIPSALQANQLGLTASDLKTLDELIDSLKNSKNQVSIKIEVSKAAGLDYDDIEIDSQRGNQIALLRLLRLRACLKYNLNSDASSNIHVTTVYAINQNAPANQVKIDISEIE